MRICLQNHIFFVIIDKSLQLEGFQAVTLFGLFFLKWKVSKCKCISKIELFMQSITSCFSLLINSFFQNEMLRKPLP